MFVVLDALYFLRRHKRVSCRLLLQIEVLEIHLPSLHIRLQGRLNFLSLQVFYFNVRKPRVAQNFVHVILGAKSGLSRLTQQLFHDVDEFIRVIEVIFLLIRKNYFRPLDFSQQQVFIFVEERSDSNSHFVNKNS